MIDIEIEDEAWARVQVDARGLVQAAALAVLARHRRADAGLCVLLADDEAVAELNQQFRGKSGPTNVLSFPAGDNPEGSLGDIALAYGVCVREAAEQGKTLASHLQHLTAHGVLHLLGYDHIDDGEAEIMEDLERAILADLGISDPYAAVEGDHD
ncbi:rRNA maturation RNase YbeY [Phenylobacterium immobile]|uniref:rRNA maturation RNase YbeY n=1 Tax=Phenylobacterium immobile TaxID=21 RepID=UPI000B29D5CF|nr:rRNA maturation RNase YbeY [Phenylobacterium immobile]